MDDDTFQAKGISPTDEQLAVQLSRDPFVIVEANAGAAKTTTLALRIAQALERGAPPTLQLALEAGDKAITPPLATELGRDYTMLKVFRAYERERRGGHPDRHKFRAEGDGTYDMARHLLSDEVSLDGRHPLAMGFHLVVV